jgi:hypothetical protein
VLVVVVVVAGCFVLVVLVGAVSFTRDGYCNLNVPAFAELNSSTNDLARLAYFFLVCGIHQDIIVQASIFGRTASINAKSHPCNTHRLKLSFVGITHLVISELISSISLLFLLKNAGFNVSKESPPASSSSFIFLAIVFKLDNTLFTFAASVFIDLICHLANFTAFPLSITCIPTGFSTSSIMDL